MEQTPVTNQRSTKFKAFVCVMLTLIVLLLIALTGMLLYGGVKLAEQAQSISDKANEFSVQVKTLNSNLQAVNDQSEL